jgi:hypothetical protein
MPPVRQHSPITDSDTFLTMSEATQRDGSIDRTTIPVSTDVRDELFDRKNPTDSYDDVLRRELDF